MKFDWGQFTPVVADRGIMNGLVALLVVFNGANAHHGMLGWTAEQPSW